MYKFRKNNAKDAFKFLEERKDLLAHKDDYEYAAFLYSLREVDLRNMVAESEFVSDKKYELVALAEECGLMVLRTPPHVGKYLNPIEIVWSIVKARARKLRP